MATVNDKLTALADVIRAKSGATGKLSLDGMIGAADSIPVGSGGGSETCTVTINNPNFMYGGVMLMVAYLNEEGEPCSEFIGSIDTFTISNVRCGLIVMWDDMGAKDVSSSSLSGSIELLSGVCGAGAVFSVSGDCTITLP